MGVILGLDGLPASGDSALAYGSSNVSHADSWHNPYAGFGGSKDRRSYTGFVGRGSLDRVTLERLYAENAIARRIVDLPADEEVRKWVRFAGIDADKTDPFLAELDRLKVRNLVAKARKWARLYGGAALVLLVQDGLPPDQPVDMGGIIRIAGAYVVDRWKIYPIETEQNPLSPHYGEPIKYLISGNRGGVDVHASRVIAFDGFDAPDTIRQQNNGWGVSILDLIWEELQNVGIADAGAANIVAEFVQSVFKIKNLMAMLAKGGESALRTRLELARLSQSIIKGMLVDADAEGYERTSHNVSGLDGLLNILATRLSGAAGIPVTLLWGISPGGLNATGESDIRFFYDGVSRSQEIHVTPAIDRVSSLVFHAAQWGEPTERKANPFAGVEPAGWTYEYLPLREMTAGERADLRLKTSQADALDIQAGVLDPAEVALSHYGKGEYDPNISLDLDTREALQSEVEEEAAGSPAEIPSSASAPGVPVEGSSVAEPEIKPADTTLNGAQLSAIIDIVTRVGVGEIARASGVQMLIQFFQRSPAQAEALIPAEGSSAPPVEGVAALTTADQADKALQAVRYYMTARTGGGLQTDAALAVAAARAGVKVDAVKAAVRAALFED